MREEQMMELESRLRQTMRRVDPDQQFKEHLQYRLTNMGTMEIERSQSGSFLLAGLVVTSMLVVGITLVALLTRK